jgi:hypothetical protein
MPKMKNVTLHLHVTEVFCVYIYNNKAHLSIVFLKCLCGFEVLAEVYFPLNYHV